ncbi:PUL domain-containing protein [Entamoeba marina]
MQIGVDGQDPNLLHFDVEVEDGRKLDLEYRIGSNVYTAAFDFIQKNELPQTYLDQVANFIVENTQYLKPQTTILPSLQRKLFPIKNYDKLQELLRSACSNDEQIIAISTMAQFIKAGKGFHLTEDHRKAIDLLVEYSLVNIDLLPPTFDLFSGLCLKCMDAVKYFETTSVYSKFFNLVYKLIVDKIATMPIKIMFFKFIANCFVTTPPELFMQMVHSTYAQLLPLLKEEMLIAAEANNSNMQTAIAAILLNLSISAINSSIAGMLAEGLFDALIQHYVMACDNTIRALLLLGIGNFITQDYLVRKEFINQRTLVDAIKANPDQTIQKIWNEINTTINGVSN